MSPKDVGVDVEVRGEKKAAADLAAIGERADDIRDASYKVRTVYRKAEGRLFDVYGPGWPPLAESTRERKARAGVDSRLMRATGALFRAMTSPRASGQIDVRKPHELRFGTDLPYAIFHHVGKGVPKRLLIDLTPAERRQMTDELGDYIRKAETR